MSEEETSHRKPFHTICFFPQHIHITYFKNTLFFFFFKINYFMMQRADSLEKALMLGKIEGKRRRGWQKMKWLNSITDSMDMNLSELQEIVKDKGTLCAAVPGVAKSQTRLSNGTTATIK